MQIGDASPRDRTWRELHAPQRSVRLRLTHRSARIDRGTDLLRK